jgi:hypothetical protein
MSLVVRNQKPEIGVKIMHPNANPAHIERTSLNDLANIYNDLAQTLGEKSVKKFSDRKSGVRRTLAFLARVDAGPEAEEASKPITTPAPERKLQKSSINFLGMRQDIKASDEGQKELKRANSGRGRALPLLLAGATYDELRKHFIDADKARGNTYRDPDIRMYEMVRIFCHVYGYGTQSSEDGSVVTLVTE